MLCYFGLSANTHDPMAYVTHTCTLPTHAWRVG